MPNPRVRASAAIKNLFSFIVLIVLIGLLFIYKVYLLLDAMTLSRRVSISLSGLAQLHTYCLDEQHHAVHAQRHSPHRASDKP